MGVVIGAWNFDQDAIRNFVAKMIILDKMPIRFVEREGFINLMSAAYPCFKIPSHRSLSRDIFNIYVEERLKLKEFFKTDCQRVYLTFDTWTSIQRINYICITAHFIDKECKLKKKIISFVSVTSHWGEYITKALENYLSEGGLKNVFTITLDNAFTNDTAISFFKRDNDFFSPKSMVVLTN